MAVGAEVAGALALGAAADHHPRELLADGDREPGVGLVVAVLHVEARVELLDPGVLQLQRLDLGVDHRPLDAGGGGDHGGGARVQVADVLEVRRQPGAQVLGLADVDHPAAGRRGTGRRPAGSGSTPVAGRYDRRVGHASTLRAARRQPGVVPAWSSKSRDAYSTYMACRDPLRAARSPAGVGRGRGVQPRARRPAPPARRARSHAAGRRRSPSTRPSRSGTPPWRCSATSCARPVDIDARIRDARAARRARGTERERSHVHAVAGHVARRLRSAGRRTSRRYPARRAAALRRRADDRLRRGHRGAPGGVGDRRARGPGVRRRLVVHRAARVRAPGAGPLRRGDGRWPAARSAVEPGAGHSAHARAHAHYETGDHAGRAGLDGRLDHRRRRRRSTASATSPGTPPCTSCRSATSTPSGARYDVAAAARARAWAAGPGRHRARCSSGGP